MRHTLLLLRLKELFNYNINTGNFIRKISVSNKTKIGDIAGSNNHGYIRIKIDNKLYSAHRLAWLYVYGEWPSKFVDHINGIKDDNRISNLREATRSQNGMNRTKMTNNKSGYKGVFWDKRANKWKAQIRYNGKFKYLGYFDNIEDAVNIYNENANILHGEFVNRIK